MSAAIGPIDLSVSDPDASPLTFTHTGLPIGVAMHLETGQITGTPTNAGTYNVTIFVSDGLKTVSRSFLWTVTSGTTRRRHPAAVDDHEPRIRVGCDVCRQTIRGTATDSGRGGSGITTVRVNGQSATGGAQREQNRQLESDDQPEFREQQQSLSKLLTAPATFRCSSSHCCSGARRIQLRQRQQQRAASYHWSDEQPGESAERRDARSHSSLARPAAAGRISSSGSSSTASAGRSRVDWSSVPTLAWQPPKRAAYRIGLWARDATTTADIGNWRRHYPVEHRSRRHR